MLRVRPFRSGWAKGFGAIVRFRQAAPVLAATLGLLALGFGLASVPLGLLAHRPAAAIIGSAAVVLPGAAVGALLAARRPGNPIGWILLGIVVFLAVPSGDFTVLYRMHHRSLPAGWLAVLDAGWPMFLVLLAVLLWLFPAGRLPTGRWRRLSAALIAAGVLLGLAAWASGVAAVAAHTFQIAISGPSADVNATGTLGTVQGVLALSVWASWLVWLAVQVPRYRRSAGERRQQFKWLYSGAAVTVVSLVAVTVIPAATSTFWQVVATVCGLGTAAFPVCIGVAVLKYQLYEIDRIISRVISYTVVTVLLAGVFAGIVVLATTVLPFKTPVAVAASTLAAAALFNPLRRRVQRVVDRRFNRARYDADQTVAAFAARLQDAVDLDSVRDDLAGVVHQALEPAHVSVWISQRD